MRRILLSVFLLLVVGSASAAEGRVSVESIRVGRTAEKSRVVFDLSGPVQYQVSKLTSPPRYVVEFHNLTHPPITENDRQFAKTPVTGMRSVAAGEGRYQITFNLVADTVDIESFPLKPFQGRGYRLVVDFFEAEGLSQGSEESDLSEIESKANSPAPAPAPGPKPALTAPAEDRVSEPKSEPTGSGGMSTSFSGTWEQEWAYAYSVDSNQKFESLIQPRWDTRINDTLQLTTIMRVRLDTVGELGPAVRRPENYSNINGPWYNDRYAELSLRELYFDFSTGGFYWRLGKQQVVWGQADGVKVLDVVNPQSFREYILDDFDDSRIPLWMVNLERSVGDSSSLQFLWIPDTSYHELAEQGSPYFVTSNKLVPNISPAILGAVLELDKPDNPWADSNTGFRFTTFVGGWDLGFNYLYHYEDTPVFYQDLQVDGKIDIQPEYERSNLVGGTFSNAFADVVLRGELAYSSDTYNVSSDLANRGIVNSPEFSSVLGLDWQATSDTLISAQWFYSQLLDYQSSIIREEREQILSLLLLSDFDNASWQLGLLALYSIEDSDALVQLNLKYWVSSNLEIWLGLDAFSGDRNGLFGQFDEQSRLLFGFSYGF